MQVCFDKLDPEDTTFLGFISNQMRKTVCTSKVKGYAGGSIAVGRFTQAKQASVEEADKEFPTTRG